MRTATSRLRAAPRESNRFVRLTQAITRSVADAQSSTVKAVRVRPAISSRSGMTSTGCPPPRSFAVICRLNARIESRACDRLMLGLSRATTVAECQPKLVRIQAGIDAGTQRSTSRAGRK